jgi:predicted O-methyltransferase YrrM
VKRGLAFLSRYGVAVAWSAYLFSFGVFSPRHRGLITRIAEHFGHTRPSGSVPLIAAGDVVPETTLVQLREPEAVDGNVTLHELLVIARMVRALRPAVLFEIGTFDGRTTLNMAVNAPADAHVYTLDLPWDQVDATRLRLDSGERVFVEKPTSGKRFLGTESAERITRLFGDSATFDFSPFRGAADFVFVDGSHAYPYVRSDSKAAVSLLSPGGVVVWHDYGVWEGVTRALDELYTSAPEFAGLRHIAGTTLVYLPAIPSGRSAGDPDP